VLGARINIVTGSKENTDLLILLGGGAAVEKVRRESDGQITTMFKLGGEIWPNVLQRDGRLGAMRSKREGNEGCYAVRLQRMISMIYR
jgi:hypothetical protein